MKRARWIAITLLLVMLTCLELTRRSVAYPIRLFRGNRQLFESCLARGTGEAGRPTIELREPSESAQLKLAELGFTRITADPRGYVKFYFANLPVDPVVEIVCCPQGFGLLRETYLAGVTELEDWQRIDRDYYYCVWDFD